MRKLTDFEYDFLTQRWLENYESSNELMNSIYSELCNAKFHNLSEHQINKHENFISTSSLFSYKYALNALNGPFPKGEAAISIDSINSFWYAYAVLKDRFILGENSILYHHKKSQRFKVNFLTNGIATIYADIFNLEYYSFDDKFEEKSKD